MFSRKAVVQLTLLTFLEGWEGNGRQLCFFVSYRTCYEFDAFWRPSNCCSKYNIYEEQTSALLQYVREYEGVQIHRTRSYMHLKGLSSAEFAPSVSIFPIHLYPTRTTEYGPRFSGKRHRTTEHIYFPRYSNASQLRS